MFAHLTHLAKGLRREAGGPGGARTGRRTRAGKTAATPEGEFDDAVGAARRGDEEAFRVLYRTLTPQLLRYATVIVGQDAEDVVSEVWLQLAREMLRFDGGWPAFRRFALTVTRNRARDLVRRRTRRVAEVSVPWSELPELIQWQATAASDALRELLGARPHLLSLRCACLLPGCVRGVSPH